MEASPINVTDIVILLLIVLSGVFAFFRGFVHELLAVVSWVGAGVATLYGFPYAQPLARQWISIQLIADMAAGIAIFLVVLVVLTVLTRIVAHRIRNSSFGPLDRSLGLIFGFLRGGVLVCLAWLLLVWAVPPEDHPEWITEARALPLVERGSDALVALLPEHLREKAPSAVRDVRRGAEHLQDSAESYQNLLAPQPKTDAPDDTGGYNERMRDDMDRAIEAATHGINGSEVPAE